MPRTSEARLLQNFKAKMLRSEEVKKMYMELHDSLREAAEESSMNLRTRKAMVRQTIVELTKIYW